MNAAAADAGDYTYDPHGNLTNAGSLTTAATQNAFRYTPASATAPPRKPSPTTNKQQPLLDQQREELSKILDTAHGIFETLAGVALRAAVGFTFFEDQLCYEQFRSVHSGLANRPGG